MKASSFNACLDIAISQIPPIGKGDHENIVAAYPPGRNSWTLPGMIGPLADVWPTRRATGASTQIN